MQLAFAYYKKNSKTRKKLEKLEDNTFQEILDFQSNTDRESLGNLLLKSMAIFFNFVKIRFGLKYEWKIQNHGVVIDSKNNLI